MRTCGEEGGPYLTDCKLPDRRPGAEAGGHEGEGLQVAPRGTGNYHLYLSLLCAVCEVTLPNENV